MNDASSTPIDTRKQLKINGKDYTIYSLQALKKYGFDNIDQLPYSIRILLENQLRHVSTGLVTDEDVANLASWKPDTNNAKSIPFMPGRVVL